MERHTRNNIAICYICIGKYSVFWKEFFESFEKNFCRCSAKHYYVFTDVQRLEYSNLQNVHIVYQKNLGWPDNTLRRYEMFLKIKEVLLEFDYIFFFNANSFCTELITEEEFLPMTQELLVVQHPFYYQKNNEKFPYERNVQSTAHISRGIGKHYICGGINGGKAKAFIQLAEAINENVKCDASKGIVALWHDESHINKYIINRTDYKLLSPAYCYPEEIKSKLPFECKILIRDKAKYIDVEKVKKISIKKRIVNKLKHLIRGK